MTDIKLDTPSRSNKDEFISCLGSCMMFYAVHLTPSEQSDVIPDIAGILKNALSPMDRDELVRSLYPGYDITLSITL